MSDLFVDLVDRRLDGELDDAAWATAVAEHGDALERALAEEQALRGAVAALPRPDLPPGLRDRILATTAQIPQAAATEPSEHATSAPKTEEQQSDEPATAIPGPGNRWWAPVVGLLTAACLVAAIVPLALDALQPQLEQEAVNATVRNQAGQSDPAVVMEAEAEAGEWGDAPVGSLALHDAPRESAAMSAKEDTRLSRGAAEPDSAPPPGMPAVPAPVTAPPTPSVEPMVSMDGFSEESVGGVDFDLALGSEAQDQQHASGHVSAVEAIEAEASPATDTVTHALAAAASESPAAGPAAELSADERLAKLAEDARRWQARQRADGADPAAPAAAPTPMDDAVIEEAVAAELARQSREGRAEPAAVAARSATPERDSEAALPLSIACSFAADPEGVAVLATSVANGGNAPIDLSRSGLRMEGMDADGDIVYGLPIPLPGDALVAGGSELRWVARIEGDDLPPKRVRSVRLVLGPLRTAASPWPPLDPLPPASDAEGQ